MQWLKPVTLPSWEVEIGRTAVQGQHRQKSSQEPPMVVLLAMGKHTEKDCGASLPGHNARPYFKNNQSKNG
jgi:hypothetical protein